MRSEHFFFALILFSSGCSSPHKSISSSDQRPKLDFSQVRSVDFKKATTDDLIREFGKPEKQIPLKQLKNFEVWTYEDIESGESRERLNVVVDKNINRFISLTWIPNEGEPLSKIQTALTQFKDLELKKRDIGWIANHEYSDESYYEDKEGRLTIYFDRVSSTVLAISLTQPNDRPIAGQK